MGQSAANLRKSDYKFINDELVDVYDIILRIEERSIRKSRFKDINIKQMHLVHAIGLHSKKTTSEVAHILKLSKGTLTANLNILERKGYIIRVHNHNDHRVINLKLTSKGRLLYRAHSAFHQQLVKSFLKGFNDDEVRLIRKAIINLREFLDKASEQV
jgi:DNA-binding MarR family transcriptional regulator